MRIVYISNYIGPQFTINHCKNKKFSISASLKSTAIVRALVMAGNDVTIISSGLTVCKKFIMPHSETIRCDEGKFKVFYSLIFSFPKCSIINSALLAGFLKFHLRRNSYDVVIYYNIQIEAFAALFFFKRNIKILDYEDNIFNIARKGKKKNHEWFKKILYKLVINKTDAAIVTGKNMLINSRINNKIQIPGAISDEVIKNINFNLKKNTTIPQVRLLLAGGLHYSKGVDLIISALNYIETSCVLNLYGSGSMEKDALELLKRVPQHHKVQIHGFTEHARLIQIMSSDTDILINTTRNMADIAQSEGYPFKMLEYAATGIPIVSSRIGKLDAKFNALVTFYENECPEEIAKCINCVIENYQSCVKNAQVLQSLVLKEYSIESISKKLQDFIKTLL